MMPVPEGSFILPTQLITSKEKRQTLKMVPLVFYKNNNYFYFPPTSVWFILTFIRSAFFFWSVLLLPFSALFQTHIRTSVQIVAFQSKKSVKERSSRISLANELTQEEFPVSQGSVGAEWSRVAWAAVAITRVRQRVSAAPQWPHSPGRSSRYPNTSVAVGRDNNRLYDQIWLTHPVMWLFYGFCKMYISLPFAGFLADPLFFIFFDENIWFACEKTYFPTKPSSINQTDAHWI